MGERTGTGKKNARTEGKEGRLAGSFGSRPNHQKTARPPSITIDIRSGQFAMSFPICNCSGSGKWRVCRQFWSAAPLQKEDRRAPFVSDLVLELARWVTPLPREWLTLMLPASASSFGQWVSSGRYVGCAADRRNREAAAFIDSPHRAPDATANCA